MKNISYLLLTLILSLVLIPSVFAKDEVKIESYKLVDKTDTTTELSNPKINGLNISFDLSFSNVKDYAKYKIIINNSTTNNYEVTKDLDFDVSDYITYSYEFENDKNIVPSKSKMTMYITVTYSKEVPADKLVDGKFIENNKMSVSLASDTSSTSKEENPNTGNMILIISILILSIALLSLILLGTTKKKIFLKTFIISLLLIPTTIFALEKLQVNVETKITVEKKYKETYIYYSATKKSNQDQCISPENIFLTGRQVEEKNPTFIIDGEEYIYCTLSITSLHKAGERITPPVIEDMEIIYKSYDHNTQTEHNLCDYDEETNTYTCTINDVSIRPFNTIVYDKEYNPDYRNNDVRVMDFEDAYTADWQSRGFIYNNGPYTMPEHDVTFIMETMFF